MLHSLDTSSFTNALQRFIARRGTPKPIRSDNASNYKSAEKESQLEKVFLRKNIVAVSFLKNVLYTHILYSFLFHLLKSFKHEHLFYLYLYMSSEHTLSFQQTDLGLRSKTISLKIIKLPTFSEITQA